MQEKKIRNRVFCITFKKLFDIVEPFRKPGTGTFFKVVLASKVPGTYSVWLLGILITVVNLLVMCLNFQCPFIIFGEVSAPLTY